MLNHFLTINANAVLYKQQSQNDEISVCPKHFSLEKYGIDINKHQLSVKKCYTTTSKAAELLRDIRNPCLILEEERDNFIVTPWDIVMKTVKSDHMLTSAD